ncbi:hypothetical protein D5Q71_25370 [Escherichia coli]|nr:hypothetical protein [Escherichia coli]
MIYQKSTYSGDVRVMCNQYFIFCGRFGKVVEIVSKKPLLRKIIVGSYFDQAMKRYTFILLFVGAVHHLSER